MFPILPRAKDKFEIQTEQGIFLATDIAFAPMRTVPTIDRTKDSYSLVSAITFKNARKSHEVIANMPLDRIMIETDSPYLTPVPYRGKRNDSRLLTYVIEKLAEWKNVSPEEMERITWENGLRLYGLEGKI